jgi:hypothetical protein
MAKINDLLQSLTDRLKPTTTIGTESIDRMKQTADRIKAESEKLRAVREQPPRKP